MQVKEGRRRQARKTTTFDASLGGRVVKIVEVVATERVGHVVVLAREPLLVGGPKIFSVELDSLFNETSCCARPRLILPGDILGRCIVEDLHNVEAGVEVAEQGCRYD